MKFRGQQLTNGLLFLCLLIPALARAYGSVQPTFEAGGYEVHWFQNHLHILIPGALCSGILLVMALYKLSIYLHNRNLSYLYHGLYGGSVFVMTATAFGSVPTLFPSSLEIQNEVLLVSGVLATLFTGLFAKHQLKKIEEKLWLKIGLRATAFVLLLGAIAMLLSWHPITIYLVCLSALTMTMLLICVGITLWQRGIESGASYTVAWCFVALGLILTLLQLQGWLNLPFYSLIPLLLGLLIEVLIVSFSLAGRFAYAHRELLGAHTQALNSAQKAKKLQLLAEKTKQEATEELERKVQERTFELEVTLRELEETNQRLEEQSTIDFLTGVRNRKYFDKRFLAETRRSRREHTPLSVIMLDIDHFKSVNDTHGHLAGDDCIRQVAHQAQAVIKRPSDVLTRYGGEEFAVILPATPAEGAMQVAEAVIKAVRKTAIVTSEEQSLSVTISAGVSSTIVQPDLAPETLLAAADQALYLAKGAGRDQAKYLAIDELQK